MLRGDRVCQTESRCVLLCCLAFLRLFRVNIYDAMQVIARKRPAFPTAQTGRAQ